MGLLALLVASGITVGMSGCGNDSCTDGNGNAVSCDDGNDDGDDDGFTKKNKKNKKKRR